MSKQKTAMRELLKRVRPFSDLSDEELLPIIGILRKISFRKGDIAVQEGEIGSSAYIVASGRFSLEIMGRSIKIFKSADFFGEIALIDARPRMGTVRALDHAVLLAIDGKDIDDELKIPSRTAMKIYRGFSRQVTSYMREGSNLYKKMDILLIQEGGCAPGYNPATGFLCEYLENAGREVYAAAEGFKSLVENKSQSYRRLIYNKDLYRRMEHFPGIIFAPPLRESRGADFRTERFPQFKLKSNIRKACRSILERNVKVVVGIGGNGTFTGTNLISKQLPSSVQVFFVPVTIDSDLFGTDCIGEYTGVEVGAEKIRCYMADSRTHKRIYIIEMMGAHGGYHALHSCLGAGAHLAVLPGARYNLKAINKTLSQRENSVIVVAEGYKRQERKRQNYSGNAATYFRDELIKAGLNTSKRIVCEAFSRDIRGAAPNNLDIMLAQRLARKLTVLIQEGVNRYMPAVLADREYSISFDKIRTDNSVKSDLASLANRLQLITQRRG
jgi:6-phosphofructokinase 1